MARNKVEYGGEVLIDLTADTVTSAEHIVKGHIGHLADGTQAEGTAIVYEFDAIDDDLTGYDILYEGSDLVFDGTANTAIVTDVQLFSEENIGKDFKMIGYNLYQNNDIGSGSNKGERCLIGAMYEVKPWPGIVVRVTNNAGSGVIGIKNQYHYPILIVERTNGTISIHYISANGMGASAGNMANASTPHDIPVSLGCELDSKSSPYRFTAGSIDRFIIAMKG